MFYETLGDLLREAAQTLHRDVRPQVADDRVRTQLDAMVALAHDVGTMWPALFAGLEQENRIYERALGRDHERPVDALAHHSELVRELNERIDALHADQAPTSRAELEQLRRAMTDAAEAQQRVIDRAAAEAGPGSPRRV